MKFPLRFFVCVVVFGFFVHLAAAQTVSVFGKVLDKDNQQPIYGAYISFTNNLTNINNTVISDKKGKFNANSISPNQDYNIKITFLGYESIEVNNQKFTELHDLGSYFLAVKSKNIDEVVVKKVLSLAIQRGDTTEMNAATFKTNPDATADDLIKKMPGITLENGTLKAHGEEVLKILVDGKDFFGEDPSVALNNLPADVIDKVQVFDKLSEQAQFSGFDDGQSVKTINIITKKNRKNSEFGKMYIGTDFKNRYIAAGNIHFFNDKTRISVLGLSNNVNQQNFSTQDLIGISTSKSDTKKDGFTLGQQIGINRTNAIGLNINTSIHKIDITGSYFFNISNNITDQIIQKDKFLAPRPDHNSIELDTISGKKINHRFNLRMEYAIDSSNVFIFIPKISLQSGEADKLVIKNTTKMVNEKSEFVNASRINSDNNSTNYNVASEFLYKHKFGNSKRTLSVSINTSKSNKQSDSYQLGYFEPLPWQNLSADQHVNSGNKGYFLSSSLVYIEPLSSKSMLYFNYIASFTHAERDKETYETDYQNKILSHIDSLSNVYSSDYTNNRVGVSYRIKSKRLKFSAGIEYQDIQSQGMQLYPGTADANKHFSNWLPNVLIQLKRNQKNNLRIYYHTSTNEPGISQLQNVIDNSQRSELAIGNPNLLQEYTHTLTCNYFFGNPDKRLNYSFLFSGKYISNFIGNQIYTAQNAEIIGDGINVFLDKNNQLIRPVNMDHAINIRSQLSLGLPVEPLLCNINYFTGYNYSQTPGYIDDRLNVYSLNTLVNGIQISSNISERVDYTFSYNWNLSKIVNSALATYANDKATYHYQILNAKINTAVGKKWVVQNSANAQIDNGFKNYNQTTVVWNFYLARKMGQANQGEIRFSVMDALNRNKNIMHNVTPQYIADSNTNSLHRYFMLMFTYNLNTVQAPANAINNNSGKKAKKNKSKI